MYHRRTSLITWYGVEQPLPRSLPRVLHRYRSVSSDRTLCGRNMPWCIDPLAIKGTEQHCSGCFPEG